MSIEILRSAQNDTGSEFFSSLLVGDSVAGYLCKVPRKQWIHNQIDKKGK
jgi:hypothetical protein